MAVTGWKTSPNSDVKLRKCNSDELKIIFGEWAFNNWNTMCLDEPGDLKIMGNWDFKEYKVPYFQIVECYNTTENPARCASPEEI
jgi:hypothetical protein